MLIFLVFTERVHSSESEILSQKLFKNLFHKITYKKSGKPFDFPLVSKLFCTIGRHGKGSVFANTHHTKHGIHLHFVRLLKCFV